MLLRISLIVAIIAGLAAGGLAYMEVTDKIPALTKQRDDENSAKKQALTELATTKTTLKKTQGELAQTQQDLADTKADRDKELARAEAQTKRADELTDKLAKANSDLSDAQNQLASYKATDLTPDQVIKLNKNLKDALSQIDAINGEKRVIERQLAATQARLSKYEGPDNFVKLKADLKGKIVVVDPRWDFVVLNIGYEQDAVQDGELLVSREGRLVAKVVIRSVQKDRCIANIVPGWKLGDPIEGDDVTPAHPAPAS
jgi:DNA repair exonuclease SbcCD ATPase subunit